MKLIYDRVLEIVRESNNTDLSNASLVALSIFELFNKSPFLRDRFKGFCLSGDYGDLVMGKTKNTSSQNYANLHLTNVDGADLSDDDNALDGVRIYGGDELASFNKLNDIFLKSTSYDSFFNELAGCLKNDHKFLIKAYSVAGDIGVFEIMRVFVNMHKGLTVDNDYDINLYIDESSHSYIERVFSYDSFFMRDGLGLMFLSPAFCELKLKDRVQEIVKSSYNARSFLRFFGESLDDCECQSDLNLKIKKIIKENDVAKYIFTKPFDEAMSAVMKFKWDHLKKVVEGKIKVFFDDRKVFAFSDYIVPYQGVIDSVVSRILDENPYLSVNGIVRDNLTIEGVMLNYKNSENNKRIEFNIEGNYVIPDGVNIKRIEPITANDLKPYDSLYDVSMSKVKDELLASSLAFNYGHIGKVDGAELIGENNFNLYANDSADYLFLKVSYHDVLVGVVKLSVSDQVANIETIDVLKPYRGVGIARILMDRVAKFCADNKKVLLSTMYTEEGRLCLPKIKKELAEKYSNFVYIEIDSPVSSIDFLVSPANRLASCCKSTGGSMPSFDILLKLKNYFKSDEENLKILLEQKLHSGESKHMLKCFVADLTRERVDSILKGGKKLKNR